MQVSIFYFCLFISFSPFAFAAKACPNILAPKVKGLEVGKTVEHENKEYPDLVYDTFTPLEGSFMIRPRGDRVENLKVTKKFVIFLHGVGAEVSNPNSMLHQWGNYTGKIAGESKAGYGKRQILNHKNFQEGIYGEILPLIGSTFGGPSYKSLGGTIDILLKPVLQHIQEAKKHLPEDAEIIIHGRSYGATIAAALAHKNPGLVDKLVLVGLATPEKSIMAEVQKVIREKEEEGKQGLGERVDQDWAWTNWYDSMLPQVKWWDMERVKGQALGGAKTLILIGARDYQVSEKEHILYADMDFKSENVSFRLVPGAEHDATKTKYSSKVNSRMGAYGTVMALDFIWNQ